MFYVMIKQICTNGRENISDDLTNTLQFSDFHIY